MYGGHSHGVRVQGICEAEVHQRRQEWLGYQEVVLGRLIIGWLIISIVLYGDDLLDVFIRGRSRSVRVQLFTLWGDFVPSQRSSEVSTEHLYYVVWTDL